MKKIFIAINECVGGYPCWFEEEIGREFESPEAFDKAVQDHINKDWVKWFNSEDYKNYNPFEHFRLYLYEIELADDETYVIHENETGWESIHFMKIAPTTSKFIDVHFNQTLMKLRAKEELEKLEQLEIERLTEQDIRNELDLCAFENDTPEC